MNWAFRSKYNPARDAKFKIKNKALITGFVLVIIITAETAATNAKIINSIKFKDIFVSSSSSLSSSLPGEVLTKPGSGLSL
jgi:hypothetical protein